MLRLVTRASSALRRPPRFPTPAGRQYRLSSAGIKPKNTEMLLPSAPPRNEQGLRREANSATAYAARSRRPEGSHHRAQATTSRECCTMQHRRTRKSLRTDGRFVVLCLEEPDQSQWLASRSWASGAGLIITARVVRLRRAWWGRWRPSRLWHSAETACYDGPAMSGRPRNLGFARFRRI